MIGTPVNTMPRPIGAAWQT